MDLTTAQAAGHLGYCERTLERWRDRGVGPEYERTETGRYTYRLEAIEDYRASCRITPAQRHEHARGPQ